MDGWGIALLVGGILLLVLVAALTAVLKAAAKTAATAQAVLVALEQVQANTAPLARLNEIGDLGAGFAAPTRAEEGETGAPTTGDGAGG